MFAKCILVCAVLVGALGGTSARATEHRLTKFGYGIRSIPAVAFFPLVGSLNSDAGYQINGQTIGFGLNFMSMPVSATTRASLLDVSAYFLGIGWSDLINSPSKATNWINWAFISAGPSFEFLGLPTKSLSLSFQPTWSLILHPKSGSTGTETVQGLGIYFAITWTTSLDSTCNDPSFDGDC